MDENAISAEIAATNESTDEDSQAKNFNENASSNTSSASETSATSSKQPVMPFILLSNPDNGYRHQDGTWMYYDAMGQTCPQDCMFPSISDIVEKSGASLVYLLNKTSLSYTEERREGVPGGYWDFGRYSIAFSPTSGRVSASSQILTPERRLTRSQILELSYWEDSADLYVEGAWDGTLSMRDTISNIIGRELTVISGDAYTLDFQFLGSGYVYTGKATRVKDSGADREYKIMILIEATSADE